ncbi:hypothetical protein [Acinetobacter calcoaceticus]|uniref:hypothetical protein n=1 Tax=Acinetobacter calcoaceticus TaxID=471 RepID=UPI0019019FB1|nr:hypothetical protein [Acinetobacter calcoaceticus]MBJ9705133.1 hypothetical protein [Acinetobacter calcoaceticus]
MYQLNTLNRKLFGELFCIIAIAATSGCTSFWELKYGPNKPSISFVSLNPVESQKQPDKIYAWTTDSNAAYVFKNPANGLGVPSACIVNADVAKSRSVENALTAKLGELTGKLSGAELTQTLKTIESLTKLSGRDNVNTSFLNVALFHICMEAGAGHLDQGAVKELMSEAIKAATSLNSHNQTTQP